MSRAIKESLKALRTWVFLSESRIRKLAEGQGTSGTRAAPSQSGSNDTKIGCRLDNGETFTKDGKEYKRYQLQVNKGADDPTLKAMADKNSHRVYSHADVPVGQGDSKDAVKQMFADLEDNIDV